MRGSSWNRVWKETMSLTGTKGHDLRWLLDQELTTEDLEWEHRLDISASVYRRMDELGINKTELARRLGVANSQVSRILSGERNMTLRTIAALEMALDFRLDGGFRYYERGRASACVVLAECHQVGDGDGASHVEWTWEVPGRETMPGYLTDEDLSSVPVSPSSNLDDCLLVGGVA